MSKRLDYDFNIFKNNLLWFFISVFLFSRLFYVLSKWHDLKYLQDPIYFFITSEYNFSLMGGIAGFFIVLFILLKLRKENLDKYIYGIVLSFTFVLPIGFIGALLGGQVYGIDTNFGIEITYNRNDIPVPYTSPLFPLPIVYSILFFLTFCGLYISNMYIKEKNILGYGGLMIFSCIIFIMEFFSGKNDLFKEYIILNLSQVSAIALFGLGFLKVYKLYKKETKRGKR
ncbi:hypothetical protein DLH72_00410 [Candidatus Gracilibacteria bacterium]|nr:MAG: hypothetical protein DLH72_00410 [Candidatus Gracilibacteria bacterium]